MRIAQRLAVENPKYSFYIHCTVCIFITILPGIGHIRPIDLIHGKESIR